MAQDLSRSIAGFPAAGLRPITRYITTHNEKGLGIFKYTDSGDHIKVICDGGAVSNHIYSTGDNPVDLADEKDIAYAARHEPPLHIHNGCVVRLIDFAPGMVSPMHRAMSIDFGIVVEGELEITLDSGESRVLRPGDMTVQRATVHKWRNISPTKPGRMLFILLDCKPLKVGEEFVEQFLGSLDKDYVTTEEYEKAQAAATKS